MIADLLFVASPSAECINENFNVKVRCLVYIICPIAFSFVLILPLFPGLLLMVRSQQRRNVWGRSQPRRRLQKRSQQLRLSESRYGCCLLLRFQQRQQIQILASRYWWCSLMHFQYRRRLWDYVAISMRQWRSRQNR